MGPKRLMTRGDLLNKLGISPKEYIDLLNRRTVKEELKPSTNPVIRTEVLANSLDDLFIKVRSSYNKAKKLDRHKFKSHKAATHIQNVLSILSNDPVTAEAIVNAGRHLYYAYYVLNVGIRNKNVPTLAVKEQVAELD